MTNTRHTLITTALALSLASLTGCQRANHIEKPIPKTAKPGKASTISERIQHKISIKVIGQTPASGRLAEIKRRGILRVALPPPQQPFQSIHPDLKQPIGFNVALAGAIADVLEVKPNITILRPDEINRMNRRQRDNGYFDITFRTPGMTLCQSDRSLPYFFLGRQEGWLTLCISGNDNTLLHAIDNSLTYFAETGIYSSLHSDYFQ